MGGVLGSSEDASRPATVVDPFEHEQRFILTRAQAIAFYSAVGARASLEVYDRERPIAYTRTTYLDTDDYACFRSCEGPVARRLRVREYAAAATLGEPPLLSGTCFLELKQNAGTTRSKIRLSAPPAMLQQLIERRDRQVAAAGADGTSMRAEALGPLAALGAVEEELASGRMSPRLVTMYRRTCMTGEGGRVRITLDDSLQFCLPEPLGEAGTPAAPKAVIASGPARVLEVKLWGETPDWLARATEGLSPAPSFSKFRVGMLALKQHGSLPDLPEPRGITVAPTLFVLTGRVA
jgi:hypothetical protein